MLPRGFTLIEVVLALALTALIIGGVLQGLTYAQRTPEQVRTGQQARALADECTAVMRWMRNADGVASLSDGFYGLDAAGGRWQMVPNNDVLGDYTRTVEISHGYPDAVTVHCVVSWDDNGQPASVSRSMLLSK